MAPTKEIFFSRIDLSTYVILFDHFGKWRKHDYHINWMAKCTSMTTTLLNIPSLLHVPSRLTSRMVQLMTCQQDICHLSVAQCFVGANNPQYIPCGLGKSY